MKRFFGKRNGVAFLVSILLISALHGFGQKAPFSRGVNLTNWFQVNSAQQIQFSKYTRTDFEQIKSLGCDVVRLPINLHFMTSGKPDYTVDPLFFSFLDQVVDWCEELNIHLILDNHTFDVTTNTDPLVGAILEKVWTQMADHYLNASSLIYFEILNEPHGLTDKIWNDIQQKTIAAIRKVDTKRTIIVGPANWNSYNNLNAMPVYSDTNLVYTFHFYDPFLFTHQGADWTDLTLVSGVPFPYSAEKMPVCPASLKGTSVESSFNGYKTDGTVAKVKQLIDIAVNFSKQRDVPVYCGEFGVYDRNSPIADRVYWYKIVCDYLEEKGVAWTIWDYQGGFGLFEKNSNGFFEHDLNVPLLVALGLNVPEQTPSTQQADTVGFAIYTDYIGENIREASNGTGVLNYYSTSYPNDGKYCISWKGAAQYQGVVFDFYPNKDLSFLKENGYALSLLVRGDDPEGQFDIRFIDTKTGDDDHPWRMRTTLSKNSVTWDNQWHKLFIPLSDFAEHGSWDNNTWYNPEGKFDWKDVDKLEIVTEYSAMNNHSLWIDDLAISNLDTSTVNVTVQPNGIQKYRTAVFATIRYSGSDHFVEVKNLCSGTMRYQLVTLTGRVLKTGNIDDYSIIDTGMLPSGMYLFCVEESHYGKMVQKIVVE